MNSNIFNAVKAFVASALIDRKTTIDQVISISNGVSESISSIISTLRCNFPTMSGMAVTPMLPIIPTDTGDALKGNCSIGREFKRTSDMIGAMVEERKGEWVFNYYFNYGRRDDSPIYDQNTLSELEKKAAYLVYLDMTAVNNEEDCYSANLKPSVELKQSSIVVTTPIGLTATVRYRDLNEYPDIATDVSLFVYSTIKTLGINRDNYDKAAQELTDALSLFDQLDLPSSARNDRLPDIFEEYTAAQVVEISAYGIKSIRIKMRRDIGGVSAILFIEPNSGNAYWLELTTHITGNTAERALLCKSSRYGTFTPEDKNISLFEMHTLLLVKDATVKYIHGVIDHLNSTSKEST